jgi:hypothetical protein
MSQARYTAKMARLLQAARHPLVREGRSWRATRSPSVRNRFNTGQVSVTVSTTFSGSAVGKLLAGTTPELVVVGTGFKQRLKLTVTGRDALRHLPEMCIKCGCTEDRACPGGCSWAAPNVCSSCAVAP